MTRCPSISAAEQDRLAAFIRALQAQNVVFDMTPWQEANLPESPFNAPADFISWFRYYAPVIRAAGVRCVYDPGSSALQAALDYNPGEDVTDVVIADFYSGAFLRQHVTLDRLAALAWSRADGAEGAVRAGRDRVQRRESPAAPHPGRLRAVRAAHRGLLHRRPRRGEPAVGSDQLHRLARRARALDDELPDRPGRLQAAGAAAHRRRAGRSRTAVAPS